MTLKQFLTILMKQWRIILICFVVVGLGAYVKSKLTTPIYQSSALVQVSVGTGSTDLNDLLANNQLVQTEVILATTQPILQTVASHYTDLTVAHLSTQVTATAKTNAQLFEIVVQDPSPQRAANLANDIALALIDQQTKQQQQAVPFNKEKPSPFLLLVQPAQPALKAVQPNTLLNTELGFLAGLFLGMLLALIVNQVDTRVRTLAALAEVVQWPVLAAIGRTNASEKEDLLAPLGKTTNVEAYRTLRTKIGLSAVNMSKPLRSVMITSATGAEGKSTIAINLALSMARSGRSVLLIDANLRNPILHEKFGLPIEKQGLSNAILKLSQPIFVSSTNAFDQPVNLPLPKTIALGPFIHSVNVTNLRLMPAGPLPPNPSELLSSKAMDILMAAIENSEFEVIIFDTTTLLGVSDTSTIIPKVDGTVVVVDMARADKKNLQQVDALLGQTGVRVLGCVVNKARFIHSGGAMDEIDEGPLVKIKYPAKEDTFTDLSSALPLEKKTPSK